MTKNDCCLRESQNIHALNSVREDIRIFDFRPSSPDYVSQISSNAGILPDSAGDEIKDGVQNVKTVGVFADAMPQDVITRVYNYKLDYVMLLGTESEIYIENIHRTLVPDIAPNIQIIKDLNDITY